MSNLPLNMLSLESLMGFDIGNAVNSAQQLTNGLASKLTPVDGVFSNAGKSTKPFTAAQATQAVQTYKKNADVNAIGSVVSNYSWIFNNISSAAALGNTGITVTTTNFDYTYIAPLFRSYGYIVSDLPSAKDNPTDTSLKYDITITWPSSTPTPITSITPSSFIAIQNTLYSVTFVPQGGQAPYTFAVTGQLPSGWSVGTIKDVASLTVQGNSSQLGGGSLILKVTDSIGQSYTATINWTVTQPAQIQADWTNIDPTSLGFIRNKPYFSAAVGNDNYYVGTTSLRFDRSSAQQTLTGVSIDGNAGTVTNGVYITGSYANPAWLSELAGSKITGNIGGKAGSADILATARAINGTSFNGSADITIDRVTANGHSLTLDTTGLLSYNTTGPTIDWAYGADDNGLQISASQSHPKGPGAVRLLCDYNGQYNTVTVDRGGIGLRSATSDGTGGGTSPYTGISMTPTNITVNGSITMGGLVTFTGGTNGLSKANVGLGNVDNVSNATLLANTTFTGTTVIPTGTITTANITTANITTANITAGTLTTVNNTNTSLVNKAYVDSKMWLALAVGL